MGETWKDTRDEVQMARFTSLGIEFADGARYIRSLKSRRP